MNNKARVAEIRRAGFTFVFDRTGELALRAHSAGAVAAHNHVIHLAIRAAAHHGRPAHAVRFAGHHVAHRALVRMMLVHFLRERSGRREGNGERRDRGGENDFFDHVCYPIWPPN